MNRPAFVKRICENGDILLGFSGEEFYRGITLTDPVVTLPGFEAGARYQVKIRSMAKPAWATLTRADDTGAELIFDEPVRAPAPGQSAVLYAGDLVAAGGFIDRMIE